ncbi:molecular chaperone DnaK [Streptomyces sp. 3330]|uniref:Hsp70 family protein n=1 Tax=Streptomyces sp. 3330 TaxID=2817755 RepID=UPI0028552F58|nr:Hsp70 family protein [Streptomyces sp. 3330]MDR6975125.1 molecular chaperone DnaK [Streptomyces sp. 3330]
MPKNNALIVILTALPVEYEAVKAELLSVRTFKHDSGTRFEEGFLRGTPWRIVIAEVGPGNENAAVIAERAAHMFRPRAVLFAGIAGSLKPDVLPGHVVVATRVHAYQGARQTEDGLLARPESWEADHELLQAARTALRPRSGTCHFKPVAAGDVVLDTARTSLRQWLNEKYNDAVAIEMEGAGVARAAHLGGGRPALVIRGISDRADGSKNASDATGGQRTAARSAAQAAMSVLRVLADELDRWDYCVSYVAQDRSWAEWAAWELRKAEGEGCRVLLRECPGTESAYRAFPLWDGVARADRILAVMSGRYLRSAFGQREWQAAMQADAEGLFRKVIPVRTDAEEPPSVLGLVKPVDLRDLPVDEAREALLAGVREAEAGAPTMKLAWFDGGAPSAPAPGDGPLPEFPGFPGQALTPIPAPEGPVAAPARAPMAVPGRGHGLLVRGTAVLADGLRGGGRRRLRRAVDRVGATLAFSLLSGTELDRAARYYRRALRLALRLAPGKALELFELYDRRVPDTSWALAFRPQDEAWLTAVAARGDRDALTVVFELAGRLRLSGLQRLARDLSIGHLARSHDPRLLVRHFDRWRELALLEGDGWVWALQQHAGRVPLERHAQVWRSFLDELPEPLLPRMFTVHLLLGRGADAASLAVTPEQQRQALDCCLRSKGVLRDLREGLRTARALRDGKAARILHERLGDLLFAAGRYREALPHYQDAGLLEPAGRCHELLGRPFEALAGCPDDRPDRLLALVDACVPLLGDLVARRAYAEAARRTRQLTEALWRVRDSAPAVAACREDVARRRDAVLKEGRGAFEARLRDEAGHDRPGLHTEWCDFEEAAGELVAAAAQAEAAGTPYRAHELYRRAGRYDEADRVLHGDLTGRGLKARAAALTAAGDLPRAAQIREEAGDWEDAITLLLAEKDLGGAIRCLRRKLGDDAVEDSRLATWLRATGELETLAGLCLAAVHRKGSGTRAVAELRDLAGRPNDTVDGYGLTPKTAARVRDTLDLLDSLARKEFEQQVPAWIARARREIDERFANIWGLDLGTSQCAAAIYDTVDRRPVACDWKGREQFPSTLCVDKDGNELVGLTMEQIQAGRAMALIRDTKRAMGTAVTYRAYEGRYRPEEVAAHLVRQARQIVEQFLAARVRERVAEQARAVLHHVPQEWLNLAEQQHSYLLSRPRVVVTIPAHFPSKARSATRDACRIAGVDLVRMIHEPTAACVAANFERKGQLQDSVVVVDLGAGTLDISHLDVGDGIYRVERVFGDNFCGSRDFDPLIRQALAQQIESRGLRVPPTSAARRRLEVAAEEIKIALSMGQKADYLLPGFIDGQDVRVSLTRAELAQIVAEPLAALRRFCDQARGDLPGKPDRLVLIGGPVLSPLVSELFEQAFGRPRTGPGDPRAAVSCGAALVAAQRDEKLDGAVIVDITPFALGIKTQGPNGEDEFTILIEPNTTIPTRHSKIFTTRRDDQTSVWVKIFSGVVSADTAIGDFLLDGIEPAPAGTPRIEVSFELDAGGGLHVTARDLDTGNSRSIQVHDSTLLTPEQVAEMTDRLRQRAARERLRRDRDEVCDRLDELVTAAEADDSTAEWREFRHRLATFRTPPELLDAPTQHSLATMHAEAASAELDCAATRDRLRRQVTAARSLLGTLRSGDITAAAVTQAGDLCSGTAHTLRELAAQTATVSAWNAELIRSAVSRQTLLTRFRDRHAEGDLSGALSVLEGLSLRLDQSDDVERLLHCIAETGDVRTRADRYRTALLGHADRLSVRPVPPTRPEEFPRAVLSALVRVLTRDAEGIRTVRTGFLVSDRLVATIWQHPAPPDRIAVYGEGFASRVDDVFPHGPESALVAVLRLGAAVPGAPLRIGHPALTRLGESVWSPAPAAHTADRAAELTSSTVNGLENVPERHLRLIRTSLRPSPTQVGAPLLNGLGEVIALLCAGDHAPSARDGFAVSADALAPLLARAGFHRYRSGR